MLLLFANEVSLGLVPDAVSCIWSAVHLRSLLPSVEMKLPQQNSKWTCQSPKASCLAMPRIQGLQIKKKDTGRLDRTQASLPGVSAAPRHLISGACGKDGCLGTSSPGRPQSKQAGDKAPTAKENKMHGR